MDLIFLIFVDNEPIWKSFEDVPLFTDQTPNFELLLEVLLGHVFLKIEYRLECQKPSNRGKFESIDNA